MFKQFTQETILGATDTAQVTSQTVKKQPTPELAPWQENLRYRLGEAVTLPETAEAYKLMRRQVLPCMFRDAALLIGQVGVVGSTAALAFALDAASASGQAQRTMHWETLTGAMPQFMGSSAFAACAYVAALGGIATAVVFHKAILSPLRRRQAAVIKPVANVVSAERFNRALRSNAYFELGSMGGLLKFCAKTGDKFIDRVRAIGPALYRLYDRPSSWHTIEIGEDQSGQQQKQQFVNRASAEALASAAERELATTKASTRLFTPASPEAVVAAPDPVVETPKPAPIAPAVESTPAAVMSRQMPVAPASKSVAIAPPAKTAPLVTRRRVAIGVGMIAALAVTAAVVAANRPKVAESLTLQKLTA